MWGEVITQKVIQLLSCCHLCCLCLLLVSGLVIQIVLMNVSQECTTILQLKVHNVYVVQKLVGHPPWQKYHISFALFFFPSVCNARSLDHQFFLIFLHNVRHHKKSKTIDPVFFKKNQMGSEGPKSPKCEVFRVPNMTGKNLVLVKKSQGQSDCRIF